MDTWGIWNYLYQPDYMLTLDPSDTISTQMLSDNYSLAAMQAPSGGITTFTRNANLQETSRQNALGNLWTTSYVCLGQCDRHGGTHWAMRPCYTFHARGQLTSVQNALGFFATPGYDSFGDRSTTQVIQVCSR